MGRRKKQLPSGDRWSRDLFERIISSYHEWGYCSLILLAQFLNEYPSRLRRYNNVLLEAGYIVDLGHLRVLPTSPVKGHWYGVSRKVPGEFPCLPVRALNLHKVHDTGLHYYRNDFCTSTGYVIPRHYVWACYAASWVSYVLRFHMAAEFVLESEHLIRTSIGLNRCVRSEQMPLLSVSPSPLETIGLHIPDARFLVPITGSMFRLEVECSSKSAARYEQLADLYRSQQTPILYLHTDESVLRCVSRHIPPNRYIRHIMVTDLDGLIHALWNFGVRLPYMVHGTKDGDVIYPSESTGNRLEAA